MCDVPPYSIFWYGDPLYDRQCGTCISFRGLTIQLREENSVTVQLFFNFEITHSCKSSILMPEDDAGANKIDASGVKRLIPCMSFCS